MRRSLLFIPGNNPAMLQNADVFGSDAVIFDLEDAVSVSEKDSARNLVSQFLTNITNYTVEIVIRINGFDTSFYEEDLNHIVSDQIDTIMLPKANINDLKKLDFILSCLEKDKKMTKKIKIIPIIELATSVLEVDQIASLPRVNGILLGAEDLTSDLEIERTKLGTELAYPRSRIIYACHAYKIDAIDTPFTDTNDEEGLKKDTLVAKSLGMKAKAAIHPNQIDTINNVFNPSQKELNWALKVLASNKEALSKGIGVFSLDGKMIDKPVIERADKIIQKAKKYHLLEANDEE